ncbi:ribonuclease H-like domain-containing protein, partial [Tanacetum coccineum]
TGDLYPVTAPSPIPHAFLVSQHTWHQCLGHPGGEVMRPFVSPNFISYNKEKPPIMCHACQLGKHIRLVSSSTDLATFYSVVPRVLSFLVPTPEDIALRAAPLSLMAHTPLIFSPDLVTSTCR